jgi:hypothetical protein
MRQRRNTYEPARDDKAHDEQPAGAGSQDNDKSDGWHANE